MIVGNCASVCTYLTVTGLTLA